MNAPIRNLDDPISQASERLERRRAVDKALAEVTAERDALKERLKRAEDHAAHLSALYGRQVLEIAILRVFYARQDAASWEAVRAFDSKGPAL